MVALNQQGEVADFVNESQFEGGESAYECVAFCAALIHYAGQPGHGPTGTGEQVDVLADDWYGRLEGGYGSGNTNGMSLDAEYTMLRGLGYTFHPLPISGENAHDIEYVKAWLTLGFPVLVCGAESGMYDLNLGDTIPYSWPPSGNHAIVAAGITPDGNLLVRDTANIAPGGVRPGPRRYDAGKMQLVSATAVHVPWLPDEPQGFDPTKEENVTIDLTNPTVATYFQDQNGAWHCPKTGNTIHGAIQAWYQSFGNSGLCGLTWAGLPLSNEMPQPGYNTPVILQRFERVCVVYDPGHALGTPPGYTGAVYTINLNSGLGVDPAVTSLTQRTQTLETELKQAIDRYNQLLSQST